MFCGLNKQLAELLSELGLLSCCLVLVHNALCASHVNLLDCSLYNLSLVLGVVVYCCVSLLESCLEVRLDSLVSCSLSLDDLYSFLSGFNVWRTDTS